MDVARFVKTFETIYADSSYKVPDDSLFSPFVAHRIDLCPDVQGMLSLRKQRLLNRAFSLLPPGECYFEVGTYHGKSLISAMLNNPARPVYAADNFSEFEGNSLQVLMDNLGKYGLRDKMTFYDADFHKVFTPEHLPIPIGLYFFDGPHDEQSQYDGIHLVEPFLADQALVLVDDWRLAADSGSYAEAGTLRAVADSPNKWRLLYELPARCNGDLGLWWNGVAVLSFERVA